MKVIQAQKPEGKNWKYLTDNPTLKKPLAFVCANIMDQRIGEEIEQIADVIGKDVKVTGFCSYGEIVPFYEESECELHNQTMILTLMSK